MAQKKKFKTIAGWLRHTERELESLIYENGKQRVNSDAFWRIRLNGLIAQSDVTGKIGDKENHRDGVKRLIKVEKIDTRKKFLESIEAWFKNYTTVVATSSRVTSVNVISTRTPNGKRIESIYRGYSVLTEGGKYSSAARVNRRADHSPRKMKPWHSSAKPSNATPLNQHKPSSTNRSRRNETAWLF